MKDSLKAQEQKWGVKKDSDQIPPNGRIGVKFSNNYTMFDRENRKFHAKNRKDSTFLFQAKEHASGRECT